MTDLDKLTIIDMSRTQQWRRMYDLKYLTAPQRYSVAREVHETTINNELYRIFTFYSSSHSAYIMTLPLPVAVWTPSAAPEPFYEHMIPFLAHQNTILYNIGRPVSLEFLMDPHLALKHYRWKTNPDNFNPDELLVVSRGQLELRDCHLENAADPEFSAFRPPEMR